MTIEGDERYYARRVDQELGLAAATIDPVAKAIHLNLAARYATLRERAVWPMQDQSTVQATARWR